MIEVFSGGSGKLSLWCLQQKTELALIQPYWVLEHLKIFVMGKTTLLGMWLKFFSQISCFIDVDRSKF